MKIELVMIGKYYAIRRTRYSFFFKKVDFLDLELINPHWRPRDSDAFRSCLASNRDEVERILEIRGCDNGVPVDNDAVLTPTEFLAITKMSMTDTGLRDLLTQVKEFYYLRKKNER